MQKVDNRLEVEEEQQQQATSTMDNNNSNNGKTILLFHSSCNIGPQHRSFTANRIDDGHRYDDEDEAMHQSSSSSSSSPLSSSASSASSNRYQEDLAQSPIICDVTILPEHPEDLTWPGSRSSDQNGKNDISNDDRSILPPSFFPVIRLSQNVFNPCGVPNLLTLGSSGSNDEENPVPWIHKNNNNNNNNNGKSSSVLLSLTSCHVPYDYNDGRHEAEEDEDDDNIETSRHVFPVHPRPSSFSISFDTSSSSSSSNNNRGDNNDVSMAEVSTEFDFGEAMRRLQALQRSTATVNSETKKQSNMKHHQQLHTDTLDRHNPWNNHTTSGPAPVSCTVDREIILSQLQTRMDEETQALNLLLSVLAVAGVVLLGVLGWAICQYKRSSHEAEHQVREIQSSMKKTRDVLETTTERIVTMQPLVLDSKLRREDDANKQQYPPVQQVEVEFTQCRGTVTPPSRHQQRQDDVGISIRRIDESKPSSVLYPPMHIRSDHHDNTVQGDGYLPVITSRLTPKTAEVERQHPTFLRPHERRWFDHPSDPQASPTETNEAKKHWDLSQLQQDWADSKETRRSHRKGRRKQPLRPSRSPLRPTGTNTTPPTNNPDDGDHSDLSSITQIDQQKNDLLYSQQDRSSSRIKPSVPQNNIRSSKQATPTLDLRDDNNKQNEPKTKWQHHASSSGSFSLSPIPPSMSETKGNTTNGDESSFINDYW